MQGLIFRVTAYHGEPVVIDGVYTRTGMSVDTPVSNELVINDPDNDVIKDLGNGGKESDHTIDHLVDDFEDEYGCMVNIPSYDPVAGEPRIFEFDIFEPSWPDADEARDVIKNLTERLTEWATGYPTGRHSR